MQNAESGLETWQQGDAYEPYVGRWSRLVAREFLRWLDVPAGCSWLDVGTGTGALTHAILEDRTPHSVLAIDRSFDYLRRARARAHSDRARTVVADACALPALRPGFDVAVSGLVLNFVPRPATMIEEMTRVVSPGGTVAAYVWDYAGRMELIRCFWDAATALNPAAASLDEGLRFPICAPDALRDLFLEAHLADVAVRAIDVPTVFRDFDDYWTPFLGGQGPAPGYAMSLIDPDRAALRERLRASLPIQPDGSISMIARAWAVRGSVAPTRTEIRS